MIPKHWHNFNSGPATLPQEVLQQAAQAILDVDGSGFSILEIPHRGKQFMSLLEEANALVRELCGLDEQYKILWLQGGGRMAFSLIPMNFLAAGKQSGYMDGGQWGKAAYDSALSFGEAKLLSSSANDHYRVLPQIPFDTKGFQYIHFTSNNTIEGTQFRQLPKFQSPAVVDMSSDFLSCQRTYNTLGGFYAVAQKNLGAAGVTLYVLHNELLQEANNPLNDIFSFRKEVEANSLVNTPPVFSIYTCLLQLRWMKQQGLQNIIMTNERKASLLYEEIERNPYFQCLVKKEDRSMMNVVFAATDNDAERKFLDFAQEHQIANIQGHRSVGAFRASLYNALPESSVTHLCAVMQEFEHVYNTN